MAGREMQRFSGQGQADDSEASVRMLVSTDAPVVERTSDVEGGENPVEGRQAKRHTNVQESIASKNFMKNMSLALLAVQNCAMILCMKYSKTRISPDNTPYLSTTAVAVVILQFRTIP
jgi:hypothetical protein